MKQPTLTKIYGNRLLVEVLNPVNPDETMNERQERQSNPSAIVAPDGTQKSSEIEVPDSFIMALQYRVGRVLQVGDGPNCAPFKPGMKLFAAKMGELKLLDKSLIISTEDVLGCFE